MKLISCFAILIAMGVLASVGQADHEVGYTESFSPNADYTAEWCVDGDAMSFRVTSSALGWVALGFSDNQQMANSDIIMLTGEGPMQDAWASARAAPPADGSQDVTLHASSQVGQTIVEFSRPIVTGDEDDLALDAERFLLWAYHQSNDGFNSRHSARGFTSDKVDFSAAGACSTSGGLDPDFNDDGNVDTVDIDALVAEIIAGTNNSAFDLSGDAVVDVSDLDQWRADAANVNGFADSYALGDANLDGTANAADLNAVGLNWLGSPNSWTGGDFTANGVTDAADLNVLGLNWLSTIAAAADQSAVPEPNSVWMIGTGLLLLMRGGRRYLN